MTWVHRAATRARDTEVPHDLGTQSCHASQVHRATTRPGTQSCHVYRTLGAHPREQRLPENKPVATRGEEVGEGKTEKGDEREQTAGHKINKR